MLSWDNLVDEFDDCHDDEVVVVAAAAEEAMMAMHELWRMIVGE